MEANRFMLEDWVLINGVPRKIEALTKKKVGYHIRENECHMHYARLSALAPIPLNELDVINNGFTPAHKNRRVFIHEIFGEALFIYIDYNAELYLNVANDVNTFQKYSTIHLTDVDELQRTLRIFGYDKVANEFKIQ